MQGGLPVASFNATRVVDSALLNDKIMRLNAVQILICIDSRYVQDRAYKSRIRQSGLS
jgi:hypothetical protein